MSTSSTKTKVPASLVSLSYSALAHRLPFCWVLLSRFRTCLGVEAFPVPALECFVLRVLSAEGAANMMDKVLQSMSPEDRRKAMHDELFQMERSHIQVNGE